MSGESMLKISGPPLVGVSRGGQEDDGEQDEEDGDSHESFILDWLPAMTRADVSYVYRRMNCFREFSSTKPPPKKFPSVRPDRSTVSFERAKVAVIHCMII